MSLPVDELKTLTFPVPFPDCPGWLIHLSKATSESLRGKLGVPHKTGWVDGLGDADFWAFEFECGLQVAIEHIHRPINNGARVVADSPEVEHVLRHLSFLDEKHQIIPEEALADELERLVKYYPSRQAEIDSLKRWQVWRIDDNGNVFKVGEPTSERAARCWVKQLEAHPHKQMYWIAKT